MTPFLPPTGAVLTLAFSLFRSPCDNIQRVSHVTTSAIPPEYNFQPHSHSPYCRSPYCRSAASLAAQEESTSLRDPIETEENFAELCKHFNVEPIGLLGLKSNDDGVRGLHLNSAVKQDDVLLSIPLSSCLRDDMPPDWVGKTPSEAGEDSYYMTPWPARLAASLLDLQLRHAGDNTNRGTKIWLSMLPDRMLLRVSLPVHWPEEVVSSAKCTALEVAVDSAYFSRAGAISDLLSGLKISDIVLDKYTDEELTRLCHDSLDIVQTRCCGVKRRDGTSGDIHSLRVIAPIFDFFNHGSGRFPNDGCPNASFALESRDESAGSLSLVVRATKDIQSSEEVLIDYGGSARSAWKCLASYGFVPEFEDGDEQNTAELYLNGVRAEVGMGTVPIDLVEAATNALKEEKAEAPPEGEDAVEEVEEEAKLSSEAADAEEEEDESPLTPAVALWIAEKASGVASDLLVDPDIDAESCAYSLSLAKSLRISQHKVLDQWASQLKEFASMFARE